MKISRWIYFPLIFIAAYVLPRLLFDGKISATGLLIWTIAGFLAGFITLVWSHYKAKKVTGEDNEEIHAVRQKRNLTLLLNYEKAFEVCRAAVDSIHPAKIKEESPEKGVIKFRTPLKWDTFGHIITINLKKLNESLTEVEIRTRPIPRTVLVGSGHSWKYVEDLTTYMKEKDAEINKKVLADSVSMMEDVYVKPFQKEKVEKFKSK
jgi:hypothetical protein